MSEVMARPVAYSIVDCPDGRFAVVAVSASGSIHRRGGLLTLAEVDICIETLRVLMEACGGALVFWEGDLPGTDHMCAE
ncbi:hypothetical protein [Methylobacterium longum]|uniref:Uncharacterized protein n=1 Tax=Methylobacterium longum TaxID=767694 RepID=A0ABT8AJG8_9HYPH|nr:hypothetical protein [Methylobacterium longum]MDN3569940.1 hypothetical protein [Methylobacterium longum]